MVFKRSGLSRVVTFLGAMMTDGPRTLAIKGIEMWRGGSWTTIGKLTPATEEQQNHRKFRLRGS